MYFIIQNSRGLKEAFDLLKILWQEKHRITRHNSVELQTGKQSLTTSKHSIEFIDSDFPCHLKVNRVYRINLR